MSRLEEATLLRAEVERLLQLRRLARSLGAEECHRGVGGDDRPLVRAQQVPWILRGEHEGTVVLADTTREADDETDALIMAIFMRDLSAEYNIRTSIRDDDHPLAKLRHLDFRFGRLPSGQSLEDVLAKRPVIKKVEGERIFFYPPTFRLHSMSPPSPEWAYALCGIRAYAPTLLEAEQEALKILRGFGHLGG